MYKLLTILLLCFGGTFCSAKAFAQSAEANLLPDFDFVKQSNIRLNSQNPTGLSYLPIEKVSMAELNGVLGKGKFIDYYQSDNSLIGQIKAESYYRIQPNIVMHGTVSYQYDEGQNMGGSVFIDPTNTPFNIVEYGDENRGSKQKETYHLVGGLSYELQNGLKLGANIDYTAANYAKRKDLRHRNKMLDLVTTLGASYPINSLLGVGANYFYRKRVEGLYFNIYGTTDQSYVSLIDFGSFYGRTEGFTDNGDGYTSGRTDRPLVDNYQGVAFQLNWQVKPMIDFSNEVYYRARDGYFGVKSSSSVVYSNHNATIVGYNGAVSVKGNNRLHNFHLGVEQEKLTNFENVYSIINVVGGLSQVEYYGENQVLNQHRFMANAAYTLYVGTDNYVPKYVLDISANVQNRERNTLVYPFYRKQSLTFGSMNVGLKRNVISNASIYSFIANVSFSTGTGKPFTEGTYAQSGATEKEPRTTQFNLNRECEFLTANQFSLSPAFRYTHILANNQQVYAQVGYKLDYAPAVTYLSHDKHTLRIAIGVRF